MWFWLSFDLEFQDIIISFDKEIWTITKSIESDGDLILGDNGIEEIGQTILSVKNNFKNSHQIKYADVQLEIPPFYEKISGNEWNDKRRGLVIEETVLLNRFGRNKHKIIPCLDN